MNRTPTCSKPCLTYHLVAFGKLREKKQWFTDLLAFLMVIWEGLRTGGFGRLGFTMLFDKIVEDATVYFLVMFSSHLLVEFCVLFAPVSR